MRKLFYPLRTCFVLITATATPLSAFSEPPAGRLLAAQCAQCHGTDGSGYESLAGESADELYDELIERKYRPVEDIMDRQARGYTDDQLRLIADYLGSLPRASSSDD
ncbi:c-type cytochrome [Methylocaldum gracile subsp. desertum]|uniref:c-type cytochrome n=1 Tax=Methylocaldum sp. GT1BW TaxID=3438964 RepID=UPI003DA1A5AE